MVEARQQLLDCFEQLVTIQRQQLGVASRERYDGQLDDIKELERQKLVPQTLINGIRMEKRLYDEIVANNQAEISAFIQELQTANTQLQHIFNAWYREASSEMQQVTVHRKTLQTYGGVNYSDVVSLYLDDRK